MNNLKTYNLRINYKNKFELVDKSVRLFLKCKELADPKFTIRERSIKILVLFVLNGFSKSTKELIANTCGIKTKNLTQIVYELTKLGLLRKYSDIEGRMSETGKYDRSEREFHPELEQLRRYMSGDLPNNLVVVGFRS